MDHAKTVRRPNPNMFEGEERVLARAVAGITETTYRDGTKVSQRVVRNRVDGLVEYGTKPRPQNATSPKPKPKVKVPKAKVATSECVMVADRTARLTARVEAPDNERYVVNMRLGGKTKRQGGVGTGTFTLTVTGVDGVWGCSASVS